jgi:hypothetical protein
MPNEIQFARQASGKNIYFAVRDRAGAAWNFSSASFVAIGTIPWADADGAMTEQGSSGDYYGSMPTAIPDGVYTIEVFERVGGTPVRTTDFLLGSAQAIWKNDRLVYGPHALGELLEDDAGSLRFTEGALEEAPAGGGAGGSGPTAEEIADEVWGELLADHSGIAGSVAQRLSRLPDAAPGGAGGLPTVDAANRVSGLQGAVNRLEELNDATAGEVADAVLDELVTGHNLANSVGERLQRIPNAAPGTGGGLPTVNASNQIVGISSTVSTNVTAFNGQPIQMSPGGVPRVDVKSLAADEAAATNLAEHYDGDTTFHFKNDPVALAHTKIASISSQTQFFLDAATSSPNSGAYVDHYAVITNDTDPAQRSVRKVTAYDGPSRLMTIMSAPEFVIAAGDVVGVQACTITTLAVSQEVDTVLKNYNLDHLVGTNTLIPTVPAGTYLDQIMRQAAGTFNRETDSLQAIRDRGDAAWVGGGGGGGSSLTEILHFEPVIPPAVDLADTKQWRIGLQLTNALDDLPSPAEITPGMVMVERAPLGGQTWTTVYNLAASEIAGLIYVDVTFNAAAGFAHGDSIRFNFMSQKVTVDVNEYELTGLAGVLYYTHIRQPERGTDGAYTGTPPTVEQIRAEIDADSTQLAAIKADTAAILLDTATEGVKLAPNSLTDTALAPSAITELQAGLSTLDAGDVAAQIEASIAMHGLDHLVGSDSGANLPAAGSWFDRLMDDGNNTYDRATDSLQAVRDRGDVAWQTGVQSAVHVVASIPPAIDLANTAPWRLALYITDAFGNLPTSGELTPGTISIDRKALGATSWSAVVSNSTCSEADGAIFFDHAFSAANGYAAGDSIRITMKGQLATIGGVVHDITSMSGAIFYTRIPQLVPTPPTAAAIRAEIDANSTQLAAIVTDTDELQGDWTDGGRLDNILDARASAAALTTAQTDLTTIKTNAAAILDDTGTSGVKLEADAVKNTTLAASAVTEIQTGMAAAVWDLTRTGHNLAGTFGETLTTVEQNIDNLDVPVSSVDGGGAPGTTNIVDASRVWRLLENGLAANVIELPDSFDGTLAFDFTDILNEKTALSSAPTITITPAIAGQPTAVALDGSKRRVHFDVDDLESGKNYTIRVTCIASDSNQHGGSGELHVR